MPVYRNEKIATNNTINTTSGELDPAYIAVKKDRNTVPIEEKVPALFNEASDIKNILGYIVDKLTGNSLPREGLGTSIQSTRPSLQGEFYSLFAD